MFFKVVGLALALSACGGEPSAEAPVTQTQSKRVGGGAGVYGFRVNVPDGNVSPTPEQLAVVASIAVSVDGQAQTPASGASFGFALDAGAHLISTTPPPGWRVGYTYCLNNTGCDGMVGIDAGPITQGSSFSVELGPADRVDMRWYFIPPPITSPWIDSSQYLHMEDSRWSNTAYAYSPSIILVNGTYHEFFCSRGGAGLSPGRSSWDYIRYSSSPDGVHWSVPTVALTDLGVADPMAADYNIANGVNASACDPSVVFWQGYYYMYFGSAYDTGGRYSDSAGNTQYVYQTVVEVARSADIAGPYTYYLNDGTWGAPTPANPTRIILKPLVFRGQSAPGGYGAGQPSVVVYNGKLRMWYTDDSVNLSCQVYMIESSSPTDWTPDITTALTSDRCLNDNDVKYDPRTGQFVIYRVETDAAGHTYASVGRSRDGVSWPVFTPVFAASQFPIGYGGVGLSSDSGGHITPAGTIFSVSGPYDQNTLPMVVSGMNWARWDLYGVWIPDP